LLVTLTMLVTLATQMANALTDALSNRRNEVRV
jgi:hypothetical protein